METVLLGKIRRKGGRGVLLDEIFMIAIMYLWWLLIGWSERNLAKAVFRGYIKFERVSLQRVVK